MKQIDPRKLDCALLPTGTPTFAELIDRMAADPELSEGRKRDLLSGLRRVARAVARHRRTDQGRR